MLIYCPVKSCVFTQRFGENFNNFYAQLKLAGHNGYDYYACTGEDLVFNVTGLGQVVEASSSATFGNKIVVMVKDPETGKFYKHYYGHLLDMKVKAGAIVRFGDIIGHTDNTGIYTTGAHLHYGVYECNSEGNLLDTGNGYGGAIDPAKWYVNKFAKNIADNIKTQVPIIQRIIGLMKELMGKIKR